MATSTIVRSEPSKFKISKLIINPLKSSSTTSFVWEYFGSVHLKESGQIIDNLRQRIFCTACFEKVLEEAETMDLLFDMCKIKSFSTKISTSSLSKHLKEDHKITKSKSVDESTKSIQRYFSSERNISMATKRDVKFILIRDLALFCCRDLLSFNLVDGQGLKDFLEKYKVSAIEDVPHRTSISRALESIYDECTVWLIDYLKSDCPDMVALTFDIWSDKYRRRSYITFTLHYVDNNFKLKNLTLATRYFPDRHTGENILSSVENIIDCYGLTLKIIYMVTDAAYNMRRACRLGNYPQLLCLGHALHNLVTVDGFKETANIFNLIKKVRDIVKALRYRVPEFEKLSADQAALAKEISDINELLQLDENEVIEIDEIEIEDEEIGACAMPTIRKKTKSLKLDVKTRWNSQLTMLKSILAQNKNVINVMLHKTDHADMVLSNMDYVLLKELVDFLQNFEKITAMFSGDKYATLNYAIVFRSEIHSLIECEPHDSDDIKLLKQNMLANFEHRFPLNDMTVLASILDTRFQNLLDVKTYLRNISSTAIEFLLKMSNQIDNNICSENEPISTPSVNQVLEKKSDEKRQSYSYLDELAEKHSTLSMVAEKSSPCGRSALERECYLLLSMAAKISIADVIVFWKDHAKLMPKLSSIAAKVYSIPATSTPSERNFSIASIVINSRRSQISPDNLDRVLFVHNNYNLIKERLFPNVDLN